MERRNGPDIDLREQMSAMYEKRTARDSLFSDGPDPRKDGHGLRQADDRVTQAAAAAASL